jgi:hypothetical protein
MPSLFKGYEPNFATLEADLVNLGVLFARKFKRDIIKAASDGYKTTKALM